VKLKTFFGITKHFSVFFDTFDKIFSIMSTIQGWFYLHVNGDLIYKNNPDAITDIRDSDLCRSAWGWDGQRPTAWQILVEASSLGANPDRIVKLSKDWKCDDADAVNFANRIGVALGVDGSQKTATRIDFVNLQESPCGFGQTHLLAMADLCKQLGFTGGTLLWHGTFADLLKKELAVS
jgi:hypothetical protein